MSPSLVIPPRPHDLGAGFTVNRVLPYHRKRMVGPFVFWDHMGPVAVRRGDEISVRPHPHIGLSTITYLFEGEILHRDSLGYEQPIRPGEVNWMTAGRGIAHSERSAPLTHLIGQRIHGIQVWIALPKDQEEIAPSFHHFKSSALPTLDAPRGSLRLIAGSLLQHTSQVPVTSPMFYLDGQFQAGGSFSFELGNQEGGIYVVEGKVQAGDTVIERSHMAVWTPGSTLHFEALEPTRLMVLGGEPFPEPRIVWWNFVSHSAERIEQAKRDWKEGRFDSVIHEHELIPLPEDR